MREKLSHDLKALKAELSASEKEVRRIKKLIKITETFIDQFNSLSVKGAVVTEQEVQEDETTPFTVEEAV